ncbi:MAG: DUF883 family protein [Ramlibacter sp.]
MNDINRSLHLLIDDAERLLEHASREAGSEFAAARERLEQSIAAGKERLQGAAAAAGESVHDAGRAADRYVHRNPWPAIGSGVAIGLVLGLVLGARR